MFFKCILVLSASILTVNAAVIVKTHSGQVEGTPQSFLGKVVNQFLGIPYAKPPIGDLRFKKPSPVEKWIDVKKAIKYGPACIQHKNPMPVSNGMSEDCLYLNVWTQSTNPAAKKK